MTHPILILAVGNESRGDDALAPLLLRRLAEQVADGRVELLEEFQLQVEHVVDLAGRSAILFIDADVSCEAPFHFSAIGAAHDHSYTSHAMTPFALLHAYRQVYGADAPSCFLLRIRGHDFELGSGLSDAAAVNLEQATAKVREWLGDVAKTGWQAEASDA
ncbi:MAG: Ni/Fe hydrogenase [Gallionellales bacterium GWA2_60_18]|nr:MAG: Ni/Fe hydrogenase [Gallionellales bacterium GWA2_60_18]